jgi:hypothetical protein
VKYCRQHPSPHYYRCRFALVAAAVLLSVLSPVVVVVVVVQGSGSVCSVGLG